ncbi:MAG TPA: DNA polymerase III subunit gamma and tau [Streptosporangiaceae bacterium]|nr:DNA polymerase III subunit gamma and tau [Streptosporangiaceae bacterium]
MTGDALRPAAGTAGEPGSPQAGLPAAPLALYRRYRPATFAEVKGQEHVTEPLRQALRSGRVHHAYLFSGPRGCGKTSSARILARSLNCEQGPTPDPCGVCASCVALAPAGPGSIDVIEIDAASHGGVDDARDLRERAFYAPVSGRFKIYIIDEAHMVTREGFNALLKLVEEPPPHLKFVFATTEPEKVIATIRSRTHHYPFRLVPPAVLREHLEQILAAEQVRCEPSVLPIVVRAGAGSVRDALSVLDQLIAGSDSDGLRYDRAVALLGYTDDRLLDEVVGAFSAGDGAAVFHAVDHVVEAGHDTRRFAADLLDRLRDLIVLSAVPDAASTGLIEAPADRLEQMSAQAAAFGQAGLTRAAEIISAGLLEMRGATSPRLLLELMCAQVLLSAGTGYAGLAERLDRLERRLGSGPLSPEPRQDPTRAVERTQPRQAAEVSDPARAAVRRSAARPAAPSPAPAQEASTAQPASPVPAPSGAPADADAIRARWPDILAAVQSKRKVAWIQLSNASVESYTDGVLTLAFAQPGFAHGFQTGGYDQDLSQVLAAMFGKSPQIKATVLAGGGPASGGLAAGGPRSDVAAGTAPSSAPPLHQGERGVERSDNRDAGGERPGASGASQSRSASRPRATTSKRQDYPPSQASAMTGGDPQPSDLPAPDVLTGTDLIERELGGRIIQELDGS